MTHTHTTKTWAQVKANASNAGIETLLKVRQTLTATQREALATVVSFR